MRSMIKGSNLSISALYHLDINVFKATIRTKINEFNYTFCVVEGTFSRPMKILQDIPSKAQALREGRKRSLELLLICCVVVIFVFRFIKRQCRRRQGSYDTQLLL